MDMIPETAARRREMAAQPEVQPCHCGHAPIIRRIKTALLPFGNPTTNATPAFGGMLRHMGMWKFRNSKLPLTLRSLLTRRRSEMADAHRPTIVLAVLALCLVLAGSTLVYAVDGVPGVTADDDTVFLIQINANHDGVTDAAGNFAPTLAGTVTYANDADLGGWVMKMGNNTSNRITVTDNYGGNLISFSSADSTGEKGYTLQMWVYLEPGTFSGGSTALKVGSLSHNLAAYSSAQPHKWRYTCGWMTFPTDTVAAYADQYDYYPVGGTTFNGITPILEGQWVCLAMTYDQPLQCLRSWINNGVDQVRYLGREGDQPVQSNTGQSMRLVSGLRNIRVGAIKLSRGPKKLGKIPPLETYVRQVSYRSKITLTLDHIDPRLDLPLTVVVCCETPNGTIASHSTWPFKTRINNHDRHDIDLPLPYWDWQGNVFGYGIKVYSGENANKKQVYERIVRITNPKPAGGRISFDSNNVITLDGTAIFPLMMYKVDRADYAQLAALGFNVLQPNSDGTKQEQLDAAKAASVYLTLEGSYRSASKMDTINTYEDDTGLGAWYSYDEPYGDLSRLMESYNAVKLADRYTPIIICQNNGHRYNESAEGCDIFLIDPYPLPNVSLRSVYDATRKAVATVNNEKPVWTVLDFYHHGTSDKRPTLQELRCMAYEALIA